MDNIHTLMLIVGKTASGKDTLVQAMCSKHNYKQLISYTTRPRRDNEGDTHVFTSKEAYDKMRSENKIAAFTEINGYYYWSTIEQLLDSDFYVIDWRGIETLQTINVPDLRLISIYINTPDDIRQERALKNRGDTLSDFRARELAERRQFKEFLQDAKFDYAISNRNFTNAFSVLKWICEVEGLWKNNIPKET